VSEGYTHIELEDHLMGSIICANYEKKTYELPFYVYEVEKLGLSTFMSVCIYL
jgi:hypothetical protein